jgi:uncharacterized UPF0160 family protein
MILRSIGTHDGTFHADEVTACALLLTFDLIDKDKIYRTRDIEKLKNCEYVCDVGGEYDPAAKLFDHHQASYNGALSSAGMVLLFLKDKIGTPLYNFLNHSLVMGVDAHDNGMVSLELGVCTFSQVITNFVPPKYNASDEEISAAFLVAVDFAKGHLVRLIERHRYNQQCRDKVITAMKPEEKVLLFDEAMPWMDLFFDMNGENHPALFVIMPAGIHWKLRGIPPNAKDRMKVRKQLPSVWGGLMDEQLKKSSGIPGAIFCHKGGFVSVWETKADALTALDWVLKNDAV